MFRNKKNDFWVRLLVLVLLSLFVNFSLLMRWYGISNRSGMAPLDTSSNVYFLYFSLAWFFFFTLFLFYTTIGAYKLGGYLGLKAEFKVFLFATGLNLILAFLLIQLYPVLQHFIFEEILGLDTFGFHARPPARGPEKEFMEPPFPFFKPLVPSSFPRPLVTEHIFVFIMVALLVLLIRILNTRQEMKLEVGRLKTEKLQTSYNALMGQINPHFFFNSLNGLNSLIQSGGKEQTLTYLNELSQVFRYILQSNTKELVTLAEELQFVKAYTYLLGVRYEGKLFFSIQADPPYLLWNLPILSILPLIENAVKHNVISKQYPLQIDIYTAQDDMLVVSNKIQPKNEISSGSGIGLKNLWGRYTMLTGKDIVISSRKEYFKVSLPLVDKPGKSGRN